MSFHSKALVLILILTLLTFCSPTFVTLSPTPEDTQQPAALPVPDIIRMPAATLEIDGKIQIGGIGSYCWFGTKGAPAISGCSNAPGIPTSREPLRTSTPFTGKFHLPVSSPPESLYVTVMAVKAADEIAGMSNDTYRFWRTVSGWSGELPLKTDVENEFREDPGLYVIQLDVRWKDLGNVSYGFLVQIGDGDSGLSPLVQTISPGNFTATALILQTITPLSRLGNGMASNLALSPDGSQMAIITSQGLYLFDTGSQQELWFKTFDNAPTVVKFSPDGSRLVVGSKASILSILNAQTGGTVLQILGQEGIHAVWSPDGTKLLTSAGCGEVNILDGSSGTLLHSLEPAKCNDVTPGYVNAVWSRDGRHIYVSGGNGYVAAWDASTYQPLAGYQPDPPEHTFDFNIEPSPTQGLFALNDGTSIAILNADTGRIIKTLKGKRQDIPLGEIGWSPDGKQLAAGNSNEVIVWDVNTGQQIHDISGYQPISGLSWMPNGEALVGLLSPDGSLNAVDISSGGRLFSLDGFGSIGVFSTYPKWDGSELLTYDGTDIIRWDSATGKTISRTAAPPPPYWAPKYGGDQALSPDGSRIALGQVVVEANTGRELATLNDVASHGRDRVAWSPDGRLVVSGDSLGMDETIIWDSHSGQVVLRLENSQSYLGALAWSRDGNQIAGASDGLIAIWDATTGKQLERLTSGMVSERIQSVAWSPSNHWLAAGTYSGRIYLWDLQKIIPVAILNGHTDVVLGLTWSPDGALLASASLDGTVMIWKLP